MISIIVPVYNSEDFLKQTIESVLCQSERNYELILVDDCSTDKSGEICDEYARRDQRIKVIHRKENGYVGKARNDGLKVATGEYIYFLDSDDVLAEDTVLEKVSQIIEEKNPDLITSLVRATEKGSFTGRVKNMSQLFIFSPYLGQSFYKREVILFYFSEERKTAEDCEWLFYNLQNVSTFETVKYPFYIYTQERDGSLTTSYKREYIRPTIDTWLNLWKANNCFEEKENVKRYCADALIEHAVYASKAKMKEEVKRCIPALKESKAKPFLFLSHIIGMNGVLFLINLKMKKKLS